MTQSVSVDVHGLNQRTSLSFLIPGRIFHYGRQSEQISIIVHERESSLNRPGVDGSCIATSDVASPLGNPGRGLSISPGCACNLSLRIWRGSRTQGKSLVNDCSAVVDDPIPTHGESINMGHSDHGG